MLVGKQHNIGVSPSGKATDSDSVMRRFESFYPSHEKAPLSVGQRSFFDLRQHRTIHAQALKRDLAGNLFPCIIFRHTSQKCSLIHRVLAPLFVVSDEKSDCAISHLELCGIALSVLLLGT